ncbi:unnamed protein product [Schistosoma turkestanicum]|nr:unnamed protein product [Schistosoma turkestanicum]
MLRVLKSNMPEDYERLARSIGEETLHGLKNYDFAAKSIESKFNEMINAKSKDDQSKIYFHCLIASESDKDRSFYHLFNLKPVDNHFMVTFKYEDKIIFLGDDFYEIS